MNKVRLRLAVSFLLGNMMFALTGLTSAQESVVAQVEKICLVAKAASNESDFSRVEELRQERLSLLSHSQDDSPWGRGARAIRTADGLLDKLQYKQACELLRAAWEPFSNAGDKPVFGDIAMKFFEVTQAALVIYPNCLQDGDNSQIATEQEIHNTIKTAVDRDPCAVEAQVVLAFLTRADPKEAFSRAEVRPSHLVRNRALLKLAYDGRGFVMPWHAPVEMLKAENNSIILSDLAFCSSVLVNSEKQLTGWDARQEPFEVIGEFLLMRLPSKNAYATPALLYMLPNRNKVEWRKLDMRILLAEDLSPDSRVALGFDSIRRHLKATQPTFEQRLGKYRVQIFDLPSDMAGAAMYELDMIGIDNFKSFVTGIKDTAAWLVKNPSVEKFGVRFLREEIWRQTSPESPYGNNRYSSLDLASVSIAGPLLILSKDTKTAVEPAFVTSAHDHPYLTLNTLDKLFFNHGSRWMEIRYPSASAYITLNSAAVPPALALASESGSFVQEFLLKAGYTGDGEATRELMKVIADPSYMPAKLTRIQIASEVHQQVNSLRNLTDSFRYLEDTRGRLIASRQSLGGPAPGVGAVPYRIFSKDGLELRDPDTMYSISDYRSLYRNVVKDFLSRALLLEPSVPLWKRLDDELCKMPPPEQPWDLNDSDFPQKKNHPQSPPNVNAQSRRVDLAEALRPVLWKLNCEAYKSQAAKGTPYSILLSGTFKPFTPRFWSVRNQSPTGTLVAIYHSQAARDAVAGRLHRAIVGYLDVLANLDTDVLNLDFFKAVPNPDTLIQFERTFISYVSSQEKNVIVRAELAAVLRCAGLKESAEFLEHAIVDQFQLSTLPVVESVIEYANSYGYKATPDLSVTRQRIESHLTKITKAGRHDSEQHIRLAFESHTSGDKAASHRKKLADLLEQAAAMNGKSDKKLDLLSREHLFELQRIPRSIIDWLAEKKLFLTKRPEWLMGSANFPQANVVCPCDLYDDTRGFTNLLAPLLDGIEPQKLTEWATADVAERESRVDSGQYHFLLAWYWLEQDKAIYTQTAFVAAARAFARQAGKGDSLPSMVATRNTILLLIAAAAISEMPPGANVAHAQYLNELKLQVLNWKRKWDSLGFPPEQGEKEGKTLENLIDLITNRDKFTNNAEVTQRYFFFDHRYDHGAIPDVLVDRMKAALETPAEKVTEAYILAMFEADFVFPKTFDSKVMSLCQPE